MEDINFKVTDYNQINSEAKFESYSKNGNTLHCFGEVLGAIIGQEVLSKTETIERLLKATDNQTLFDELVGSMVGNAFLLITNTKGLKVYATMSTPALYYYYEANGTITFSNSEQWIYEQFAKIEALDEKEFINVVLSHHIMARNAFDSLFINIGKLIPGARLNISENGIQTDLYFLNINQQLGNYRQKKKRFQFLMEKVIPLIRQDEDKRFILLKSGGIDSSVLLAAAGEIDCLHVPYWGREHGSVKLASKIVASSGNSISFAKLKEEHSFEYLLNRACEGLGSIPGPQYLNTDFDLKQDNDTVYALSGQNLDTLYYVDTFAPSSTVTGYRRTWNVLRQLPKRVIYYWVFHSNTWRFLLNPLLFRKQWKMSFTEFLGKLSDSINEHGVIYSEDKYPIGLEGLSSVYKENRREKLLGPVKAILEKSLGKSLDDLDTNERLTAIKTLRWCRTVHNVPTTYQNIRRLEDVERVIVYNHGPLANFFLNYRLSLKEMFIVKPLCHDFFRRKMGSYTSYVKSIGNHPSLWSLFKLRMKQKLGKDNKKRKPESLDISREMDIIKGLMNTESNLTGQIKSHELKKLFSFWEERINNHQQYKWNRSMSMMACRFVNAKVFIGKVLENESSTI